MSSMSTATASSSSDGTIIDKTTTTSQMPDGSQQISVTTHMRKSDGTVTKKIVTRTVFSSRASSGDWSDDDLFLGDIDDVESADNIHSRQRKETQSFLEGKDVICDVPLENLEETRTPKNRVTFATNVDFAEINGGLESKSTTTLLRNKKCKAAIMIFLLWGVTVTLLIMTLVFDWFRSDGKSCVLCKDGLDFEFTTSNSTPWPTHQPSSTESIDADYVNGLGMLKPPPNNLAQICSPSILLDKGPNYSGAPSRDLVAICTKVCMPAVCCLGNNEEAKKSLLSILEMQGMGALATSYLASMKDCYDGNNVAICDAYSTWCGTLFDLDTVLMSSVKKQMDSICSNESDDSLLASSRNFAMPNLYNQCVNECNSVECCFQNLQDFSDMSNPIVERKRKREHDNRNIFERVRAAEGQCQQYSSLPGSVTYKICSAYAEYCNPLYSESNQSNTNSIYVSLITRTPTTPVTSSVAPSRTPVTNKPSPSIPNSSMTTASPTMLSTGESSDARNSSTETMIDTFFDGDNNTAQNEGYCVNTINCTEMATEAACGEIGCSWSAYSCIATEVDICRQFETTASCEKKLSCEWMSASFDSEMINTTQNEAEDVPASNSSFTYIPSPSPTIPSPSNDFVSITSNKTNPASSQSFNSSNNATASMSNDTFIEMGLIDSGNSSFLRPSAFPTSANVSSEWPPNTSQPALVLALNSSNGTDLSVPSAYTFPTYTPSLTPETAGNAQNTTLSKPSFPPTFQFPSFGNISNDSFLPMTPTPLFPSAATNSTYEVPTNNEN